MSKINYNFPPPIPYFFNHAGWFTKNAIGHKNRTFIQWAFFQCMCCDHEVEYKGSKISLGPFEFLYSCVLCEEETGLSRDESQDRLYKAISLGILVKVQEKSTRKFCVYRWIESEFKKAHQNHYENSEKKRTKTAKSAPESAPESAPKRSEESAPKYTVENDSKSAPNENQKSAPESAPESAPFLKKEKNDENFFVEETLSFAQKNGGSLDAAKKYKLTAEQITAYRWLKQQGIDSNDDTLSWYAKKYSFSRIKDVVFWAQREKRDSPGAYIRHLFNTNAIVETDLCRENKQLSLDYKTNNQWNDLEIQEFYVVCRSSRNGFREVKLDMDSAQFLNQLMQLHSWYEAQI